MHWLKYEKKRFEKCFSHYFDVYMPNTALLKGSFMQEIVCFYPKIKSLCISIRFHASNLIIIYSK